MRHQYYVIYAGNIWWNLSHWNYFSYFLVSIMSYLKRYLEWLFQGLLQCLKKLMFSDYVDEWIIISLRRWQHFLSLFPFLAKSSLLKFLIFLRSLIFTGCTSFLFESHSQAYVVQAGLVSASPIAASTRNKAAATWLHVELIPAMQVQWVVITFPSFLDKHTHSLRGESFNLSDGRQSLFNKQYLLEPKLW